MRKNLKINIALIACAAFIFRLTCIQVGCISSHFHDKSHVKTGLSKELNGNRHFEFSNSSSSSEFKLAEIFYEDSDEDKLKSKVHLLRPLLYSLAPNQIKNDPKQSGTAYESFSASSSHRYLEIQV